MSLATKIVALYRSGRNARLPDPEVKSQKQVQPSQRAPFAVKVVSSDSAAMTWFSEDFGSDLAPLFFLAGPSTPTIVGMCGVQQVSLLDFVVGTSNKGNERPTKKKQMGVT